MNLVITYIAVLIPMIALDALWILLVAKQFYAQKIGFLFAESANMVPVLFFYPLYALGIAALVVSPALASGSWFDALWRGAVLGLVSYGAYDLTNHATIANWPLSMTLVDMAWGMTVTALAGLAAYTIVTMLK
jgi:uncharacterized membrane protein